MGVFLDTGFILAMKLKDDRNHSDSKFWMERFLKKEYGSILTSTYVFDEVMTLILTRIKNEQMAIEIGEALLTSSYITIIHLDEIDFKETWQNFRKYAKKELSFTDCSILTICKKMNCNFLATYDKHFNGLIKNILD